MPTANLVPDDAYVRLGHGVHAATAYLTSLPGQLTEGIPAAVNVGVRPTFETGRGLLVEAHLIGFDDDIYGETLRLAFIERLRGEKAGLGRRAGAPDERGRRASGGDR